jgi:bacterioferritin
MAKSFPKGSLYNPAPSLYFHHNSKPTKGAFTMADKEKRKKNVIEVLNKARAMELQAISQYMNQHYNLDDKDYGELAAKMKLVAIDEMRHAEAFAERIKELGGEPTTEPTARPEKGQAVQSIFPFDADLEDDTIDQYNQFLLVCRENGDSVSMKIFEQIIEDEQAHYNYFDAIANHINDLGDTYLARIAGTSSATGLQPQGFVLTGKAGA